jgi:hypothetical protein
MGATTRDPDIYILVESGTPPCQRTVAVWAAHRWWSRGVAVTVDEMRSAFMLVLAVAACAPPPAAPVHPAAPDHELHVSIVTQGNALHATIVGHEVALERLPIAEWLSLPMSGRGEIAIDVTVPVDHGRRDFRGAKGTIDLRCVGPCSIGDDHGVVHVARHELEIGKVALGELEIHALIGDGKLTVSRWTVRAPDFDVVVMGRIELAAALDDSVVAGCVRVKSSLLDAAGDLVGPRASDGRRDIRIAGHVGDMHRLPQICDGSVPIQPDLEPQPVADASGGDDELVARAIHQVDATAYEIDHELIDQVLANPMSFSKGARVVPAMKDGKPLGFKLYAIRPASLYARLGLLNGDTLVSVNGFELTSADKALEIYTKLREASRIEIVVERKGVQLTLAYSIR